MKLKHAFPIALLVVTAVLFAQANFKVDVGGAVKGTFTSLEVGDGTKTGGPQMLELTANGSNYVQWSVQDSITANLILKFADSLPTAGQVAAFSAPSSSISTVSFVTPSAKIWLAAAGGTAAAPALLWDTLASDAPTAACSAGSTEATMLRCYAEFPDSDGPYSLQQTIMLPSDWTGAIDLRILYRTVATTGNTVWQAATACRTVGEVDDVAYNTANKSAADAAQGTTLFLNEATITGITTTGCAAGELLHLKVFRNRTESTVGDTLADVIRLNGVEVTTRRAMQ